MGETSQDLIQQDIDHLIHPVTNLREHSKVGPRIFVKGEGITLTDIEGKKYIDGISCLFNVAVGHGRYELAAAAVAQMSTLAYATSFTGFSSMPAIKLATKLASLTDGDLNHFFFTSGGAESLDSAFKFARYYWKLNGKKDKVKIISRRFGYHGITIGAMSATGIEAYQNMFGPLAPGFLHIGAPYCYRCEFGKAYPGCNLECALALEEAIVAEGQETVAAFLAEPVQGIGGIIVPPAEYFPRIREICDKYNVLLIADEVITGFCRTGKFWGMQNWGVKPDMFTFAKAVTSGYFPLGGVAVSDRIRDQLISGPEGATFMHGFTYSGHPTGCAVALANLDIFEREDLLVRAREKGEYLQRRLKELTALDSVGEVRGIGLLAVVDLTKNKVTRERFSPPNWAEREVLNEALARGLIFRVSFNGLAISPPLIITEQEIDRVVDILAESIKAAEPRILAS